MLSEQQCSKRPCHVFNLTAYGANAANAAGAAHHASTSQSAWMTEDSPIMDYVAGTPEGCRHFAAQWRKVWHSTKATADEAWAAETLLMFRRTDRGGAATM